MPLDPAVAQILDLMSQAGGPPLEQLSPEEARAGFAGMALLGGPGADVASVVEREVGGVRSLVITPHGSGPFPVLVWIHGGGWVIGRPEESLAVTKDLAAGAGCIVVSVDYRLAPEHKAPAAYEDCLAATGWVLDHAAELGGDPAKVAVGGDSAGGHLSAQMAAVFGARLSFQALVYPVTDFTMSSQSYVDNAEGYLLTAASMRWFTGHYIEGTSLAPSDPAVSPLHVPDEVLVGQPPTMVITAEFDPLRDEGEAYAARLAANGVTVH